jgi:hypothetical protein
MFGGILAIAMLVVVPLLSLRFGADSRGDQRHNWH